MDYYLRRKQIKEEYYPILTMFIITVLPILGLLLMYLSGGYEIRNITTLSSYVSKNIVMIITCIGLFIYAIYCWISFYLDTIRKPINEVLYLDKIDYDEAIFLNKKGKEFKFKIDNESLEEHSYYNVLKTKNFIDCVFEKVDEYWVPEENRTYFVNYYSPVLNFKNKYLTIVYLILVLILFNVLKPAGSQINNNYVIAGVIIGVFIYDFFNNMRLLKNKGVEIGIGYIFGFLKYGIAIGVVGGIFLLVLNIFLNFKDSTSQIVFLPFVGIALCNFIYVIAYSMKKGNLAMTIDKIAKMIFLSLWFGFLIFFTVGSIKQEGNLSLALYSIPFWIFGFVIFYDHIIKKK